ncbi:UNVERIFIED_ORG: hypothetical protein J2W85_004507 [Ensifer adhaerens]|nr:hypothetical protein [Ensifer adhaerens]
MAVAMLILRGEAFNRSSRARTGSGSAAAGAWYAYSRWRLEADVDAIVERFMEILPAIPITVLALVLVSSLGRNLVYGIEVARSQALTIRNLSYIDAAVTLGFSDGSIEGSDSSRVREAPFHLLPPHNRTEAGRFFCDGGQATISSSRQSLCQPGGRLLCRHDR